MNTNEDGTLNYATVIDTSGIDKGQRISNSVFPKLEIVLRGRAHV